MITPMVTLTDPARTAVRRFMDRGGKAYIGLRVAVSGAGCSGVQYALALIEAAEPGDRPVDCGGVTVFVDGGSVAYLAGTTIDFTDSAEGRGFRFDNPNAVAVGGGCHCGKAVAASCPSAAA